MSTRHTMQPSSTRRRRITLRAAVGIPVIALALLVSGCSGDDGSGGDAGAGDGQTTDQGIFDDTYDANVTNATAEEQGWDWPLTVDGGEINCLGDKAYAITVDGTDYALNDEATAAGASDLQPIWLDDPRGGDLKIDRTGLTLYAAQVCKA